MARKHTTLEQIMDSDDRERARERLREVKVWALIEAARDVLAWKGSNTTEMVQLRKSLRELEELENDE